MKDNSNNDIFKSLGRLEGKVDAIIHSLSDHASRMNRIDLDINQLGDRVDKKLDSHERRLSTLERKQYTILTVAIIAWGAVLTYLRKFF